MTTLIASSTPSTSPDGSALSPYSLKDALAKVKENDTIQLRGGDYLGPYLLSIPGVTLLPYQGEPAQFVGADFDKTAKTPWLRIAPAAKRAKVMNLSFVRDVNIAARQGWHDLGIVTEADEVTLTGNRISGMNIGIHVKGTSLRATVTRNHVGPTYQSNIVVASSANAIRGLLIGWNILENSYIEDGIQLSPAQTGDTHSEEHKADLSNRGAIIYHNLFSSHNENGIDAKGVAQAIIDGNVFRRGIGSVDGPVNGWNHMSPATIMRGSNASSKDVIVRNNDLEENSGGIRVYTNWHVYHNRIWKNNYSPFDPNWKGFGLSQIERPSFLKNNLVAGHKDYDVDATTGAENNPTEVIPGVPLTKTKGAGSGRVLPVVDAGYFTDWFGRTDLPPDVIYLGGDAYSIADIDYVANTVRLDRDLTWVDGQPVFWRSPTPMTGIQEEYTEPVVVEPPIVVPSEELVTVLLETSMSPVDAAQFRALLAGRVVTARLA